LSEGQRFEIEFKNKMKQEAGMTWSRKRKTIQLVNVAAVRELDNVSSTQVLDRRRCLGRVREWSNTISYMKRCIRTNC
jgi:hypothetical protein